jgi:hypothetical protein
MHQWDIVVGVSGRERSHPISSAAANANASTSSKNTVLYGWNLQTLQQELLQQAATAKNKDHLPKPDPT